MYASCEADSTTLILGPVKISELHGITHFVTAYLMESEYT